MISSLLSLLITSRNQAHVFHLQTSSYAAHKALDEYYSEIVGFIDNLAESYQGKHGIIRGYNLNSTLIENATVEMMVDYFEKLSLIVEQSPKEFTDSYIQNQIDEIVALIRTTIYKLRFLK